jgi:hypothetical protein
MVGPGARRQEFGGSDLDAHLQQLLKSRCVALALAAGRGRRTLAALPLTRTRTATMSHHATSGVDVGLADARAIKEQHAYVCEVRCALSRALILHRSFASVAHARTPCCCCVPVLLCVCAEP